MPLAPLLILGKEKRPPRVGTVFLPTAALRGKKWQPSRNKRCFHGLEPDHESSVYSVKAATSSPGGLPSAERPSQRGAVFFLCPRSRGARAAWMKRMADLRQAFSQM